MSASSFGQTSSFVQFEGGLLRNQGGFFKLYDGIVDIGAGYHLTLTRHLEGGLDFNLGFLNYKNTPARSNFYRPKLSLQYTVHVSSRVALDPVIGLGYSFIRITNNEYLYASTQHGLNYAARLKVRWKSGRKLDYYLFGSYDYIYLDRDDSFTQLNSFRQIRLFAVGLGVNIKSGVYE